MKEIKCRLAITIFIISTLSGFACAMNDDHTEMPIQPGAIKMAISIPTEDPIFIAVGNTKQCQEFINIEIEKTPQFIDEHGSRECSSLFSPEFLPLELLQNCSNKIYTYIQTGSTYSKTDNKECDSWVFCNKTDSFIEKIRLEPVKNTYNTKKRLFKKDSCIKIPVIITIIPQEKNVSVSNEIENHIKQFETAKCLSSWVPEQPINWRTRSLKNAQEENIIAFNEEKYCLEHGEQSIVNEPSRKRFYSECEQAGQVGALRNRELGFSAAKRRKLTHTPQNNDHVTTQK